MTVMVYNTELIHSYEPLYAKDFDILKGINKLMKLLPYSSHKPTNYKIVII